MTNDGDASLARTRSLVDSTLQQRATHGMLRPAVIVGGTLVFVISAAIAIVFVPHWLLENWLRGLSVDAANTRLAIGSAAQTVLFALGGVIALVGVSLSLSRHSLELASAASENRKEQRRIVELNEQRTTDAERELRSRFTTAVSLLSNIDKTTTRFAGLYALAALADDWKAFGRDDELQVCIDVICSYLRSPWDPVALDSDDERNIRSTGFNIVAAHLRSAQKTAMWHGARFNFRGALLDYDVDWSFVSPGDTRVEFNGAEFKGGEFSFQGAQFGGELSLAGAQFTGGHVNFYKATFTGQNINFSDAEFWGGTVDFGHAQFTDGNIDFRDAQFWGGTVNFDHVDFSHGRIDFGSSWFAIPADAMPAAPSNHEGHDLSKAMSTDSKIHFDSAIFTHASVDFNGVHFDGGDISFHEATFNNGGIEFIGASFGGGTISLDRAKHNNGRVDFSRANFTRGQVSLWGGVFLDASVSFHNSEFSGGDVLFRMSTFNSGEVLFGMAEYNAGNVDFGSVSITGTRDENGNPFRPPPFATVGD